MVIYHKDRKGSTKRTKQDFLYIALNPSTGSGQRLRIALSEVEAQKGAFAAFRLPLRQGFDRLSPQQPSAQRDEFLLIRR